MRTPDHLTGLLRNLYAGQEAIEPDMEQLTGSKLGKEYDKDACFYNLYAEYIKQNARLNESQAGIKIARRTINNLRYAEDTTLMTNCEEVLKSLLKQMKEKNEKAGLKLSIKKKLRSWPLIPSLHGKQKGKKWKQ